MLEDQQRTEPLFAALPLSRRDIVAGRYLTTALIAAAGLGLLVANAAVLRALPGDRTAHLSAVASWEAALLCLAAVAIAAALFYPLYFRFGLGRGALRFTAVVLGLAIALSVAEWLAGTGSSAGMGGAAAPGPVALLGGGLLRLRAGMGRPLFWLCAGTAVAAAVRLSLRLSIVFYGRRDL